MATVGENPPGSRQSNSNERQSELAGDVVARELAVFRAATTTLKEATQTVQNLHEGATVSDVSFDDVGGKPVYRVKTFKDLTVWEDTVNGLNGSIEDAEITSSITDLSLQDRRTLANVKEAKASLPDAISVAERAAGGAAISGGAMTNGGRLSYVIVVSNGDVLKQFMLDPPQRSTPVTCRISGLPGRSHRAC